MSGEPEGNTAACARTRVRRRPCGVADPTHAWKLGSLWARENRETLLPSVARKAADRWEKAMSSKAHMHGRA